MSRERSPTSPSVQRRRSTLTARSPDDSPSRRSGSIARRADQVSRRTLSAAFNFANCATGRVAGRPGPEQSLVRPISHRKKEPVLARSQQARLTDGARSIRRCSNLATPAWCLLSPVALAAQQALSALDATSEAIANGCHTALLLPRASHSDSAAGREVRRHPSARYPSHAKAIVRGDDRSCPRGRTTGVLAERHRRRDSASATRRRAHWRVTIDRAPAVACPCWDRASAHASLDVKPGLHADRSRRPTRAARVSPECGDFARRAQGGRL